MKKIKFHYYLCILLKLWKIQTLIEHMFHQIQKSHKIMQKVLNK